MALKAIKIVDISKTKFDVLRLKAGGSRSQAKLISFVFQGKSFLHLYLCSVAEGGEPRMVMTDRKNTPLAKRIIMSCVIS